MFHLPASAMTQAPSLTKWHAYLQQRNTLCPEIQTLLDPVEYVEPPASTPVLAPATCRAVRKIPAGDWYTDDPSWGNLSTWMAVAIQLHTETI